MKPVLKRQTKRYQLFKVGITYQLKDRETGQNIPLDFQTSAVLKLLPYRSFNEQCSLLVERAELISQNLSLILSGNL